MSDTNQSDVIDFSNYNSLDDTQKYNFTILYMAYAVHEKYDMFMELNDGKVKESLNNPNNPICKLVKSNFGYLDDKWVHSMTLSMMLMTFMNVVFNPTQ